MLTSIQLYVKFNKHAFINDKEISMTDNIDLKNNNILHDLAKGTAMEILDKRAIVKYQEGKGLLEEQLIEAKESEDWEKEEEIKSQIAYIDKILKENIIPGGKPRKYSDERDKARKSISGNIDNCIKKISQSHSSLATHLKVSIHKGYSFAYFPQENIYWECD